MTDASKLIIPLGNLNTPLFSSILSTTETTAENSLSQTRFWHEFAAGMKMLTQHLGRNKADLSDVLHRNLTLLHRSLKTEKLYQQFIQNLPMQSSGYWKPIAHSEEIYCGIVNIVASQETNLSNIVGRLDMSGMSQKRHNRRTEYNKSQFSQGIISLLIIEGKLQIARNLSSPKNNSHKQSRNLKPGNTHIQTMSTNNNTEQLECKTASCQVLMLAIPIHQTH